MRRCLLIGFGKPSDHLPEIGRNAAIVQVAANGALTYLREVAEPIAESFFLEFVNGVAKVTENPSLTR